jgi:hypothetical protein
MNIYCDAQKYTKRSLITTVILSGVFVAFASSVHAGNAHFIGKKGTPPNVTHFISRPVHSLEIPGVGTTHLLEAVGTTQNLKGEPMLDKMAARCTAAKLTNAAPRASRPRLRRQS